jgi:hypothetical protein
MAVLTKICLMVIHLFTAYFKRRITSAPTGNNRSKSYLVNMILISLKTSNFSSNVRISRELSIRSDENYVVSSMVTTTVVLLEI